MPAFLFQLGTEEEWGPFATWPVDWMSGDNWNTIFSMFYHVQRAGSVDEDADPDFEEMVGGLSFFQLSSVGHSGSGYSWGIVCARW